MKQNNNNDNEHVRLNSHVHKFIIRMYESKAGIKSITNFMDVCTEFPQNLYVCVYLSLYVRTHVHKHVCTYIPFIGRWAF